MYVFKTFSENFNEIIVGIFKVKKKRGISDTMISSGKALKNKEVKYAS